MSQRKLKHRTIIHRLSAVFERCQASTFTTVAEDNAIQQALQTMGATGIRQYPRPTKKGNTDTDRINKLQELIVDAIYLDDGGIIDVCGGNLREVIDAYERKEETA